MKKLLLASLLGLGTTAFSVDIPKKTKDKMPATTNKTSTAGGAHDATSHDWAKELSITDVKKAVDSKSAFIIDANGEKTYKEGHIPGAVNFGKNEKNFASLLPQDKNTQLIAYCGGPMCTAWEAPAKAAQKLGYTNIAHFKGGIKEWKEAGMPIQK